MQKNTKKIIGVSCALGFILILIFVLAGRSVNLKPADGTQWTGPVDYDILTPVEENYSWKYDDNNYVEGKCSILQGKEAEKYIDTFTKQHKNTYKGLPKEEMYGFEDEMKLVKKQIKEDKGFLLCEHLSKTVSNGKEIESQDQVYLGFITREHGVKTLSLNNILRQEQHIFHELSDIPEEKTVFDNQAIGAMSDDIIDVNFELPEGYLKEVSGPDYAVYTKAGTTDYAVVDVMKNTPVSGILDEYPNRQQKTANEKEYYTATNRLGARVLNTIMFEKKGSTYKIEATDPEAIEIIEKTLQY